jgi:hypothetical protein
MQEPRLMWMEDPPQLPACAANQQFERFAYRDVIVNDENDGWHK